MEKFHSMLNRLGLARSTSSDEDGKRSAQSTPRLGRSRVRDLGLGGAQPSRYGSLGSMEGLRVNQHLHSANTSRARDRSWESERVAPVHTHSWEVDRVAGLDRAWEIERSRGLQLVYRSMEREKERRIQLAAGVERDKKKKKKKRDRSKEKYHHQRQQQQLQQQLEQIDTNKLSQERLERRVDELNRMLLSEQHRNRKDKLAVAKLQQEVARQKSERSLRETLMKELEREKLLRLDAEQRLRDVTAQKEDTQAHMGALADEFKRMEETVKSAVHYKSKIEQLKEDKASLSISYEKTVQKYTTLLGNMEEENQILMAENKRLESQCANCDVCNKDLHYRVTKGETPDTGGNDRVKVLLERLKKVEEEKSQLVLENETQRQQYEKCLDEIANQVVQALISQKTLREECSKLRRRVLDLEDQNKQLNLFFQQRIKFASDSVLQSVARKRLQGQTVGGSSGNSLNNLVSNNGAQLAAGGSEYRDGEYTATPFSEFSLDSLHSMCSDYAHSGALDDDEEYRDLGKAKPSSPPPWVRDKLFEGSPTSSISSSGNAAAAQQEPFRLKATQQLSKIAPFAEHNQTQFAEDSQPVDGRVREDHASSVSPLNSSPDADEQSHIIQNVEELKKRFFHLTQVQRYGSKIETEFPATNDSPKMKHVSRAPNSAVVLRNPDRRTMTRSQVHQEMGAGEACALNSHTTLANDLRLPSTSGQYIVSPGQELLNIRDSFHERYELDEDGVTRIRNDLFVESDTDSDSSENQNPQNRSGMGSTVSLNELLERGLEGVQTPADDSFSIDNFNMFDSEEEKDEQLQVQMSRKLFNNTNISTSKPDSLPCESMQKDEQSNKVCCSSQTSPELENTCECGNSMCGYVERNPTPPLVSEKHTLQRPSSLDLVNKRVGDYVNCYSSEGEDDQCPPKPAAVLQSQPFRLRHPVLTAPPPPASAPPDIEEQDSLPTANSETPTPEITSPSTPKKVPPPIKPKPKRDTTQDSGILISGSSSKTDIAIETDQCVEIASSASPDSAMQQSFSSTSSTTSDTPINTVPSNEKLSKDDGYSSNSTPSVTCGDCSKLDVSPEAKHSGHQLTSPPHSNSFTSMKSLSNSACAKSFLKVAKVKHLNDNTLGTGYEKQSTNSESKSPNSSRRLCGPGESDVSMIKSPRSPPSFFRNGPLSCPPMRRLFGSQKRIHTSPYQPYNAHSDTCVYRPYFYRRPHYRRMCSQTSKLTNENPANKLFRTLSDSALHRHRFRYTDRIVHNIFMSLKAIARLKARPKIIPGSSGVDHPDCHLPTRHREVDCLEHYSESTVGYMMVERTVDLQLVPGIRTLGEGSENGYKSREDMRPDGKTMSSEMLEKPQGKPTWLLWSSDSEDEEIRDTKRPMRFIKQPNQLQIPSQRMIDIKKYVSPTENNSLSRDLLCPDGSSTEKIEIVHSPIPNSQPDLLSGTIIYKGTSGTQNTVISDDSSPSPDDGMNPIEDSVRLLNNVGIADGIIELEKGYKSLQEQHFRQKNCRKARPDSEDHGYFDTETISINHNSSDHEDQCDFTDDIESLSRTVDDLQKSLSSLNELDTETNENLPPPLPPRKGSLTADNSPGHDKKKNGVKRHLRKKPLMGSRIKKLHVESSDSEKDLDTTEVDVTNAESRANFLDSLVMLSSSSDDDENYINGRVVMGQAAAKLKRGENAPRCPLPARPSIANKKDFFVRYGEQEQSAINSFAFLHDLSPSHSPSHSDEDHLEFSDNEVHGCNSFQDSGGKTSPPGEIKDMLKHLRLNPPKNPRVSQLVEECRDSLSRNRLSSGSFESTGSSFGVDGLSLSDSCCESFSSSDGSGICVENDITSL